MASTFKSVCSNKADRERVVEQGSAATEQLAYQDNLADRAVDSDMAVGIEA